MNTARPCTACALCPGLPRTQRARVVWCAAVSQARHLDTSRQCEHFVPLGGHDSAPRCEHTRELFA